MYSSKDLGENQWKVTQLKADYNHSCLIYRLFCLVFVFGVFLALLLVIG